MGGAGVSAVLAVEEAGEGAVGVGVVVTSSYRALVVGVVEDREGLAAAMPGEVGVEGLGVEAVAVASVAVRAVG